MARKDYTVNRRAEMTPYRRGVIARNTLTLLASGKTEWVNWKLIRGQISTPIHSLPRILCLRIAIIAQCKQPLRSRSSCADRPAL